MSSIESLIFALLLVCSAGFFLKNFYRLFAMICLGRWENRFDQLWSRFKGMLLYAFGQLRVVSEKFGLNHFLLFWGFMVLLLLNVEFLMAGLFARFSFAFLGDTPYGILLLMGDVMSLVVFLSVVCAVIRRTFFRPAHIEASLDAFFILALVALLMLAYFGLHGLKVLLGQEEMAAWLPISRMVADLFAGCNSQTAQLLLRMFWWIHALVLLLFLNYLPYSKHLHILTAIPNCFFRSFSFVSTMPKMIFRKGLSFGISRVVQFSWKDLLDFLACTECGRCARVCPATSTGKVLNPKLVIQQGKLNLLENGSAILESRPADTLASAPDNAPAVVPLINQREQSVSMDAIWACTTCGACMERCPVFIEHVPKLLWMRRHLVMEKADFPEELIGFFENSEQRFNPWGIVPTERTKWAQELDVKILADGAEVEYLFFVGCAGAFDSRNRQVTSALTRIFDAAQLSWGILGTEEKCCGDSQRRLGNEYVFDQLARENIGLFKKYGIGKIVTYCPHCFSTLHKDYKQFGADFEVIHHSQLIYNLLRQKKLAMRGLNHERIVLHDSCYLGRHNDIFREPRAILKAASGGRSPLEMKQCGNQSFCCGAGGGRMWMEERAGKKIYQARTQEALQTKPSTIAVACPYCLTMFEDGVKDEKAQDTVRVRDLAEIVVESMSG